MSGTGNNGPQTPPNYVPNIPRPSSSGTTPIRASRVTSPTAVLRQPTPRTAVLTTPSPRTGSVVTPRAVPQQAPRYDSPRGAPYQNQYRHVTRDRYRDDREYGRYRDDGREAGYGRETRDRYRDDGYAREADRDYERYDRGNYYGAEGLTGNVHLSKQLASATYIANTMFGTFEIPNFDLMSRVQQQRERNTLELRFKDLVRLWKDVHEIEGPREGEDLMTMAIRYKENEQFLLNRGGTDIWSVCLLGVWGVIEWGMDEAGYPIHGYALSQLKQHKAYQALAKQMGFANAFGAGWSPLTKTLFMAGGQAVLLLIVSKTGGAQYAPLIMNELTKSLCGSESTTQYSENGAPKPPTDQSLGAVLSNMVPEGAVGMMQQAGGIKGLISMGMSFMSKMTQSDAPPAPRTEEVKSQQTAARRRGPTTTFASK